MYRFRPVIAKIILPFIWLFLFGLCLLSSYYPSLIAQYYTQGLFRFWTLGLRYITGGIPFALGELVYIIIIIILIINIINYFISLKNFNQTILKLRFLMIKFTWLILKLFVIFELIWGLNYLQPGPTKSFGLTVHPPKNAQIALAEVSALTYELILELNKAKVELSEMKPQKLELDQQIKAVQAAYTKAASDRKFLMYQFPNIKKAIFPNWGDYIGYLAFYQPVTGEAILRADLPILTQPYTIAHEIAHQLGYASETEANFIAYVVAVEQGDPVLKYSMLLQMFSYAQDAQLFLIAGSKGFDAWKAQIEQNKTLLSPDVRKDRASITAFFAARAGKQIQTSSKLYDQFLKWNQQAAGLASYQDVLKWVRAYRIKTGSSTSYSQ